MFGRQHDFSAYNVYYAAQYWQKYVDACRQQGQRLSSSQYLEVRYEDLLADQEATMRTISDFLGERWLPAQRAGRESGAARKLCLPFRQHRAAHFGPGGQQQHAGFGHTLGPAQQLARGSSGGVPGKAGDQRRPFQPRDELDEAEAVHCGAFAAPVAQRHSERRVHRLPVLLFRQRGKFLSR
ncbi:MAG: hypothetical protein B7Z23_09245 [Pseudomonadales bacterium 32-61-5]|nr:MAG: hypothetical protein B7Z23_09245 [Pseudomonadales bacterium 32-61-5]